MPFDIGREPVASTGAMNKHADKNDLALINLWPYSGGGASVDMKLEAVVVPVSDVDRAKSFYKSIGFQEDADYASGKGFRVVQFTPPGSITSIIFGTGITEAVPGSLHGLHLLVRDIEAARADLITRSVDVCPIFHDVDGVFYRLSPAHAVYGPDPERRNYASFARFWDPDGNGWVLQEMPITAPAQ